jgi:hypothetical protein
VQIASRIEAPSHVAAEQHEETRGLVALGVGAGTPFVAIAEPLIRSRPAIRVIAALVSYLISLLSGMCRVALMRGTDDSRF